MNAVAKILGFRTPASAKKMTIAEAQAQLDDMNVSSLMVTKILSEFRREFHGQYPEETLRDTFTATGPFQTFLGFCIAKGYFTPTGMVDLFARPHTGSRETR